MFPSITNCLIKLSAIITTAAIVIVASLIPTPANEKVDVEILHHLKNIERCLKKDDGVVIVQPENYYTSTELQFLKEQVIRRPAILMNYTNFYRISGFMCSGPKYVFIFIKKFEDLSLVINYNTENTWAGANYIIVVNEPFQENEDTNIKDIMEFAIWKAKIINFIVIFYEHSLNIVTYNPFSKQIINFSSFSSCNIYPDKTKNLHKYQLKVSMFFDPPQIQFFKDGKPYGADITLLEIISHIMNFSIEYVAPEAISNFSPFTDSHIEVLSGKTDFCFITHFVSSQSYNAQYSYPHKLNDVVVMMPKIPKTNKSRSNLQKNFDVFSWLAITASIFTIATIQYFSARLLNTIRTTFLDTLFFIWSVLLGVSILFTSKNTLPLKLLLVLWMLCAMLLNFNFQCLIISKYIQPPKVEYIDTLKELSSSRVAIKVRSVIKDKLPKNFGFNLVEIDSSFRYQTYNGSDNNTALATPQIVAEVHIKRNDKLRIVKEHLIPAQSGYYFPLNSPYIQKINRIIMLSNEFGIIKHIENVQPVKGKQSDTKESLIRPLQITEVKQAFNLLIAGCALSTLMFLSEIMFFKMSQRQTLCKN